MTELGRLTPLTPHGMRADRLRHRCHAELARRAARARRIDAFVDLSTRVLVPVLLGTVSAVYTVALVAATMRVEGWLR